MEEPTKPSEAERWAVARAGAVAEWAGKGAAAAATATSVTRPLFLLGFGAGVVLNDACASCWFNFLFVFLERVQGLTGAQVGTVFLAGQLSDALATPLIGYLADRAQGLHLLGLGRRQLFYLLGVAIVSLSFVFVFAVCLPVSAPCARPLPLFHPLLPSSTPSTRRGPLSFAA